MSLVEKAFKPDNPEKFLADFTGPSWAERKFGKSVSYHSYDVTKCDFAKEIRRLLIERGVVTAETLGDRPLEELHHIIPKEMQVVDGDLINAVTAKLYGADAGLETCYQSFLREVVQPLFGCKIAYQKTMTIRFYFPNQDLTEGRKWHNYYHTDIMLGHPPQEVNIWFPLTRVQGSAGMLISSGDESRALYQECGNDLVTFLKRLDNEPEFLKRVDAVHTQFDMKYGDLCVFDSRCLHRCQFNQTDTTRVSIDVRMLPEEVIPTLGETYKGTGRMGMAFKPGHYYSDHTIG